MVVDVFDVEPEGAELLGELDELAAAELVKGVAADAEFDLGLGGGFRRS